MSTVFLNINHVRDICFALAQEFLTFDEPIPSFETRFPDKLEAILNIPQQGTKNGLLYPTITEQAAVLFYSLVKEHPFLNGNKRLAVVSLLTFLSPFPHMIRKTRLFWFLMREEYHKPLVCQMGNFI